MKHMEPNLFFVYGTLKSPYGNNKILENSEFIDYAISLDTSYIMRSNGNFPKVKDTGIDNNETYAIIGELYLVSDWLTLIKLDALEGNGFFYKREIKNFISFTNYKVVPAWIYLYMGDLSYESDSGKFFKQHENDLTFAPYLWRNTDKRMSEWVRS